MQSKAKRILLTILVVVIAAGGAALLVPEPRPAQTEVTQAIDAARLAP